MTMKLTGIKQQVKNPDRYSLFVEGKYAFSLSADALLDSRLVTGQALTGEEIDQYKRLSAEDKAYGLALAYVVRRMRSRGELQDYFRRKQYAPELSRQLLKKLQHLGFVNDEEFAMRWVENRRLLKATSTKKLLLELRQKHIDSDIIERVLTADGTDEKDLLRQVISKKRQQSRYQDKQKLIAYLARQGYSYDDIKTVLNENEV